MVPLGEGVFETLRIADSRPHALARHLARLREAAGSLGLEIPSDEDIRRRIAVHLAAHPLPSGRMRLSVTGDAGGAAIAIASAPTPPALSAVRVAVSDWQVTSRGPLVGIKSTAYVDYLAALRAGQQLGFDEALLVNTAGLVCETTTANVFFVLDGALCTPALSTGCLPGIARGLILELCGAVEVDVPVEALAEATEVFLTSSLRAVQVVTQIGDQSYPDGGPVTRAAQKAWYDLAERTWDPAPPPKAECEIADRVR